MANLALLPCTSIYNLHKYDMFAKDSSDYVFRLFQNYLNLKYRFFFKFYSAIKFLTFRAYKFAFSSSSALG